MDPSTLRCPQCGSTLASGADGGAFCSACLLRAAAFDDDPDPIPDQVGPYQIVRTLGEGGMGVVYLAEQQAPIQRLVALKVIKIGMDTREVVRRFEAERQTLALMDHPHIARVIDAGAGADGRPYFAMEYVPGLPITEFCDQHGLSIDARLALMQRVCTAVQHAHQRGIIHRDLKPSNVLVTLVDAEPVPKVIDFGIARAIEQDALVHTLATSPGQLIGTPEYMSPEQASLRPGAVGTETDIYALGLILYELLAGALPFDLTAFRDAGFDEMCRIAREVDAPKPSARSRAIDRPEDAARARGTHPSALEKRLRGELDWIVLKALDKEPVRRYASAAELGADLGRFLHHEPVAAGPPSAGYRSRKFVRKHRVAVAAVSLVVLVLAATTAVSTWLYLRAEAARLEAEQRRDESEHRAYRTNILAADLSLAAGEVREARRLLDATPERLRGWEWGYLTRAADSSTATLTPPGGVGDTRPMPVLESVTAVADRLVVIGTRFGSASSRDGLTDLPAPGASAGSPIGTAPLPDHASVLATSGDGNHLLVTRWYGDQPSARTVPGAIPGSMVEFRLDHLKLANDARNRVEVIDRRSGRVEATLTLGSAGVWRGRHPNPQAIGLELRHPVRRNRAIVEINPRRVLATVSAPVVISGVLNADGSRAALWTWDNVITVWEVAGGRLIAALSGHGDFVSGAVFTADSSRLVSGSYDGTVRTWDLRTARASSVSGPHAWPATAIGVSPSGGLVAAGFEDRSIQLWRDGQPIAQHLRGHTGLITSLAFSADGAHLVSASEDRTVRLWDTTKLFEQRTLRGHETAVTSAVFTPDQHWLVSTALDGTLRVWDLQAPIDAVEESGRPVAGVAFIDHGSAIVSGHGDDAIRVWDLRSGAITRLTRLPGQVTSFAVSADGRRLVVGLALLIRNRPLPDMAALVLDPRTLRPVARLTGQQGVVKAIAISADGSLVATAADTDIVLWNALTGQQLHRWSAGQPRGLSLTGDGLRLAAGLVARDKEAGLMVWPARSDIAATLTPTDDTPIPSAAAVAFARDGSWLVSGGDAGVIQVWDVRSGRQQATLAAHDAGIQALAISPDGSRIASASADRTVRLWDAATHELLLTFRLANTVQSLAFSDDGGRLAAGVLGGTIRIWYSPRHRRAGL